MIAIRSPFLLLFFIAFLSLETTAQNDNFEGINVNQQLWLDYNENYQLTTKLKIYGDAGSRFISPNIWTQFYIRPSISFTPLSNKNPELFSKSSFHGGLGFFMTFNKSLPNHFEIRPFQGYQFNWPTLVHLKFDHYFRLEERFINYNGTWNFNLRFRYMLSGDINWTFNNLEVLNNFYFPFHIELFFNITDNNLFNDLIRITPGIGYQYNQKWKFEFSGSYHRSKIDTEDVFKTNNIVFRLRAYHTIF